MASRAATFLSAAEHIGHRVCDDALWRGDTCTWEGPLPTVVDGRWSSTIRPFGAELYSGTSGVALFLARLHRATGERRFGDTAAAAARDAVMRLGELPPPLRSGLYTGFGGIALASLAVGDALDDEDFTHTGLRLLGTIRRLDPAAQSRDLLSGTAGAIALLLASYRKRGLDEDLDAAARFGAFLAGAANRDGDAWSWSTYGTVAAPGERDLAGLAHGAAGIAFALLELHEATGEPAFLEAAEAGYSYEQRWFSAERGNWADVR
ncbi:MAG: lantibiotic biosynthesis protein, partial [Solirubrobacteraceae bacterium]|nr:lantibiotic biosynthesis protein [Solirubrobacteraceae bacterium]